MLIYLIVFLIVIILTFIAQIVYKKNKYVSYGISAVCIMILSLFAALRANTVGSDVLTYGLESFNKVGQFSSLFDYINSFDSEPAYYLLNYIIYYLTNNIHVFFFILQLINVIIVYNIAYKEKENMWLCVLIYLMLWYNASFNILRQTTALFIMLFAFRYLEKNKLLKYYICVFIAFLFHKSSLIYVVMPILNKLFNSKKYNIVYFIMIILMCLIYYAFGEEIISYISNVLPYFSRYATYFSIQETNFNIKYFLVKLVIVMGTLLFVGNIYNKKSNNFLIYSMILETLLYINSDFIRYGYRISYFFTLYYIILIPRIDSSLMKETNRKIFRLFIVSTFLFFWYFRNVRVGYDATIPYMFYWNEV